MFVLIFIPSAETQAMFNELIKNTFTPSFGSWYTDKHFVNDGSEFQNDIGSTPNINSPNYLIAPHQSQVRTGVLNKASDIAVLDSLDVRKYFVRKTVNSIRRILLILIILKVNI